MITNRITLTPTQIISALANDDPTTINEFSANLGSQTNLAQALVVSWFCDPQRTSEERQDARLLLLRKRSGHVWLAPLLQILAIHVIKDGEFNEVEQFMQTLDTAQPDLAIVYHESLCAYLANLTGEKQYRRLLSQLHSISRISRLLQSVRQASTDPTYRYLTTVATSLITDAAIYVTEKFAEDRIFDVMSLRPAMRILALQAATSSPQASRAWNKLCQLITARDAKKCITMLLEVCEQVAETRIANNSVVNEEFQIWLYAELLKLLVAAQDDLLKAANKSILTQILEHFSNYILHQCETENSKALTNFLTMYKNFFITIHTVSYDEESLDKVIIAFRRVGQRENAIRFCRIGVSHMQANVKPPELDEDARASNLKSYKRAIHNFYHEEIRVAFADGTLDKVRAVAQQIDFSLDPSLIYLYIAACARHTDISCVQQARNFISLILRRGHSEVTLLAAIQEFFHDDKEVQLALQDRIAREFSSCYLSARFCNKLPPLPLLDAFDKLYTKPGMSLRGEFSSIIWECAQQEATDEFPLPAITLTNNSTITPVTAQLMRACLHAAWQPSQVTDTVLLDKAAPQPITRDIFYRALRNSIIPDSLIAGTIGVTTNPQADSVKKFCASMTALLPSINLCDTSRVVCNLLTSLDISGDLSTPREAREKAIIITIDTITNSDNITVQDAIATLQRLQNTNCLGNLAYLCESDSLFSLGSGIFSGANRMQTYNTIMTLLRVYVCNILKRSKTIIADPIAWENVLTVLNADSKQKNSIEIPLLTECAKKIKNKTADNVSEQQAIASAECN